MIEGDTYVPPIDQSLSRSSASAQKVMIVIVPYTKSVPATT